jgi:hypothetical protein
MGLPRLPPLWQGARWQLARYDNRRSIHSLGGSLRRVKACLDRRFLIVLPKHTPPPPSTRVSLIPIAAVACFLINVSCFSILLVSIRASTLRSGPF